MSAKEVDDEERRWGGGTKRCSGGEPGGDTGPLCPHQRWHRPSSNSEDTPRTYRPVGYGVEPLGKVIFDKEAMHVGTSHKVGRLEEVA